MKINESESKNMVIFFVLIIIIFVTLVLRAFTLQIVEGGKYSKMASSRTTTLIDIPAKRGDIVDRNGVVLASSVARVAICIDTSKSENEINMTTGNLAKILAPLGITKQNIEQRIKNAEKDQKYLAEITRLDSETNINTLSTIYERMEYLPAINLSTIPTRTYPMGSMMGVTLGYVGAIDSQTYNNNKNRYSQTDSVGKSGLEAQYETFTQPGYALKGLNGTKGVEQVQKSFQGSTIGQPKVIKSATSGDNLQLSIDVNMQRDTERSLAANIADSIAVNPKAGNGSAIMFDVKTGEILAISSYPDFDPNDFIGGLTDAKKNYYLGNTKDKPMLNKVTQSLYPPGSTFKMVTGLAALHYGGLTPQQTFYCDGVFHKPGGIVCESAHGWTDLVHGLKYSCNVYFQNASILAGIDNMSKIGREFGLGADPGMDDIAEVATGSSPNPKTKEGYVTAMGNQMKAAANTKAQKSTIAINQNENLSQNEKIAQINEINKNRDKEIAQADEYITTNKPWYNGDTYNSSIGQGYNFYSVLQLGEYVSAIANGGNRLKPMLVKKVYNDTGQTYTAPLATVLDKVGVTTEELNDVRAGMREVTKAGGTGYKAFGNAGYSSAGKTGTAETGIYGDSGESQGVYVGYAPYEDPQVGVAVLIEYAKRSSTTASYVARKMIDSYFINKK